MKKNEILMAVIIALLISLASCKAPAGLEAKAELQSVAKEVGNVVPSDVAYQLRQQGEDIVFVEIREREEFLEEHIPGAIWIPHSKLRENDPEAWAQLETIAKMNKMIVLYCGAGHRSGWLAEQARERGLENVYNLDGITFWNKKYPTIKGERPPERQPRMIHLDETYFYYTNFPHVKFIDVREPESIARTGGGVIKGSKVVPLGELVKRLDEFDCADEHVFVCEGTYEGGECTASPAAAKIIIDRKGCPAGKQKYFNEGYGAWRDAKYPTEQYIG